MGDPFYRNHMPHIQSNSPPISSTSQATSSTILPATSTQVGPTATSSLPPQKQTSPTEIPHSLDIQFLPQIKPSWASLLKENRGIGNWHHCGEPPYHTAANPPQNAVLSQKTGHASVNSPLTEANPSQKEVHSQNSGHTTVNTQHMAVHYPQIAKTSAKVEDTVVNRGKTVIEDVSEDEVEKEGGRKLPPSFRACGACTPPTPPSTDKDEESFASFCIGMASEKEKAIISKLSKKKVK